jgi:thymidylate synthase (FAD)
MNLVEKCQWKQQQARSVLPLDTKTTLIHTAFVDDWVHFFNLRAIGTTGAPHPQAKELAEPLMNEFIKRNYLTDELKRNLGKKQNEYNTTI